MSDQAFAAEIGPRARGGGGDSDRIATLIELGTNPGSISRIQGMAARTMSTIGYVYPRKACAATLSHFLREAGIDVPITTGAQRLADRLRVNRKWDRITLGNQQPGDVGVCFSLASDVPGADHIYLVVERKDEDLMMIADNQAQGRAHQRSARGKGGKTPTEYFLRASRPSARSFSLAGGAPDQDIPDEPTSDLPEPYMDDGSPSLMAKDGSVVHVD